MNLELTEIIQIATLITLIAGFIFGILEVRRARRARSDKGALDVLGIAVSPDHIAASYALLELPDDAAPDLISSSPDMVQAANTLMVQYEYLGNLVYQRIVPLDTLDLLVGGIIRATWKRMHLYVERERADKGIPNMAEWFQWLAERLQEYGRPEKALGTQVAFKNWKP